LVTILDCRLHSLHWTLEHFPSRPDTGAEPDLCIDDPSRKLLRQIFGSIAEYEKTMLVLKLRGARQRKRKATGV
jgi:hypothetical protein